MFSIPTARRPTSRRSSATSAKSSRLIINDFRRLRGMTPNPDQQTEILADLHPSMRAPAGEETKVQPVPKATFHEAVFNRIKAGTDRYAPVVVPATYFFTGKTGAITDALHPVDPGVPRSHVQDDVWNWVWLRRVVYFLTVFATLFVAFIPFFVIYAPDVGHSSVGGFVVPIVNAAASFLPGFLEPWFVAFRNAPGFVLADNHQDRYRDYAASTNPGALRKATNHGSRKPGRNDAQH